MSTPRGPLTRPVRGRLGRAAIAVVCAGFLAAGLGVGWAAVAHVGGREPRHAEVVPWQSIPPRQAELRLASRSLSPKPCTGSSLRPSARGGGGAGGTFYVPITITNVGSDACVVDRRVGFSWRSGQVVTQGRGSRVLLRGGRQLYRLAFPPSCTRLVPARGAVPVTGTMAGEPMRASAASITAVVSTCRTAVASVVVPADAEDSGTGPYSALRASLTLPASAAPGGTLAYTLTLTNRGSSAWSFESCPTYLEQAGSRAGSVSQAAYTLDCLGGGPIPSGASRSYAMRLPLPPGSGLDKVAWIMDDGPSATGTITAG